jgi:hypothetical protein
MNWSRGLFRLWVIAAVIWTVVTFIRGWNLAPDIVFGRVKLHSKCEYFAIVNTSQEDRDVERAVLKGMYDEKSRSECLAELSSDEVGKLLSEPPTKRELREINAARSASIVTALESFHYMQKRRVPETLMYVFSIVAQAAVPSLIVLSFGWAVLWAFAGFSRR